jgi:hypothetical protein
MTAEEQQMLQGLLDRINSTRLSDKDPDAEQLIQQVLGRNPDALYILAQTVLVQGYALDQAQKQNVDLRAQLDQARQRAPEPAQARSFLGNLLGRHDEPQRATPVPPPTAGYGPGLTYPSGGYPIAGSPGQGSGFLRSAMQTATGVVAGELAFQGIESLMHGFGHAAGYGSEFGGAGLGAGRPEGVVSNHSGGASAQEHGTTSGLLDRSGDVADRKTDSTQLGGAADASGDAKVQGSSYGTDQADQSGNADDLSGTEGTDYSSQGDDSMLSDDIGDGGAGSDSGDDSGGGSGDDSSGL